jgi:hypothetical protein
MMSFWQHRAQGAANVLRDLKIVVDTVNTETINSAFAVTIGAKQDLDSFM